MRITLTLDDDVAAKLEQLQGVRQISLGVLVNEALRRGLGDLTGRPGTRRFSQSRSVSLGRCLIGNVDDVSDALAIAEGETVR